MGVIVKCVIINSIIKAKCAIEVMIAENNYEVDTSEYKKYNIWSPIL